MDGNQSIVPTGILIKKNKTCVNICLQNEERKIVIGCVKGKCKSICSYSELCYFFIVKEKKENLRTCQVIRKTENSHTH